MLITFTNYLEKSSFTVFGVLFKKPTPCQNWPLPGTSDVIGQYLGSHARVTPSRSDKTQKVARTLDARSVVRKNARVVRSSSRLVFLTRSVVPLQLPVPAMLLPEPVRAWFRLLDTKPCLPACLLATRRNSNLDEEYGIVFCRVSLSSLVWSSGTIFLSQSVFYKHIKWKFALELGHFDFIWNFSQ